MKPRTVSSDNAFLLLALLSRSTLQAVVVLIMARLLGAAGYGRVVWVLTALTAVLPFLGLGLPALMLRLSRRHDTVARLWALGIRWSLWVSIGVGVGVSLLALMQHASLSTALGLALALAAETAAALVQDLTMRRHQAQWHPRSLALWSVAASIGRCGGVGVVWMTAYAQNTIALMVGYGGGACLAVAIGSWLDRRRWGPQPAPAPWIRCLPHAVPLGIGGWIRRIQEEAPRLLGGMVTPAWTGFMGLTQRVIGIVLLPAQVAQESAWPHILRSRAPLRDLPSAILPPVLAAGLAALGAWWVAPWVPWVLGPSYHPLVGLIRLGCLLPLFQVLRNAAVTLASARMPQYRQIVPALIGVGVTAITAIVGMTHWGARGLVMALYAGELTMILAYAGSIRVADRTPSVGQ